MGRFALVAFILLSTFNWSIALLPGIVPFIFRSVRLSAYVALFLAFILAAALISVLIVADQFSAGSEVKFFFVLGVLSFLILNTTRMSNAVADKFSSGFIFFGFTLYFFAIISGQNFFRFLDSMPGFSHYLSIYFGVSCALICSVARNKHVPFLVLLALLNGSGTGIVCLAVVLTLRYKKIITDLSVGRLMVSGVALSLIVAAFIAGQAQRGRSIENYEAIDRYVILTASLQGLRDLNFSEIFFGVPFGSGIPVASHVDFLPLREYLEAEHGGKVYPRSTHSDYFRILYQYGLVGIALFLMLFFSATKQNLPFRYGAGVAMLFNSIVYITPLIFVMLIVLSIRVPRMKYNAPSTNAQRVLHGTNKFYYGVQ